MSHPTCCCSASLDRCDRCDLLVGLEGFHLVAAARREYGLMLDIESCDRRAGCPGCGVIAQGHGRVVVEVIDAPWAGVPVRIRWFKRRWICRETTCQIATFSEQNHSMCAPRARLGVRAIRWAIRRACQFFCVWGLEVGGDSVGVGGGELGEGLFPVGGGVSLDEAGVSCSFVGGFASVCEALGGSFVFDVADGEP